MFNTRQDHACAGKQGAWFKSARAFLEALRFEAPSGRSSFKVCEPKGVAEDAEGQLQSFMDDMYHTIEQCQDEDGNDCMEFYHIKGLKATGDRPSSLVEADDLARKTFEVRATDSPRLWLPPNLRGKRRVRSNPDAHRNLACARRDGAGPCCAATAFCVLCVVWCVANGVWCARGGTRL